MIVMALRGGWIKNRRGEILRARSDQTTKKKLAGEDPLDPLTLYRAPWNRQCIWVERGGGSVLKWIPWGRQPRYSDSGSSVICSFDGQITFNLSTFKEGSVAVSKMQEDEWHFIMKDKCLGCLYLKQLSNSKPPMGVTALILTTAVTQQTNTLYYPLPKQPLTKRHPEANNPAHTWHRRPIPWPWGIHPKIPPPLLLLVNHPWKLQQSLLQ